ncbi:cardiolipin synthase [Crenichthys baileyi]|uniref:Cardiolipin synthase (CMP-forming) n=2 Tax=Goodeidae TaxID=28758 RepID=A0AAV9RLN5_9TELE
MALQKELRTAEMVLPFELFRPKYENPWTVPNLLCVCRILLAPYLGYLITQQHFDLSLALFALAGATDLLDGLIARTWPTQKSALGSALDPLADKILISVLYVSLTYAELIPAPLTALVIFRDIGLIAAVFWVRYKTVPPPVTLSKFFNPCYTTAQLKPTLFSKVNTAIQLFLVAASLAAPVFQFTDSVLLQCLWYITAVTTAASGYSYWHYGRKTVQQECNVNQMIVSSTEWWAAIVRHRGEHSGAKDPPQGPRVTVAVGFEPRYLWPLQDTNALLSNH